MCFSFSPSREGERERERGQKETSKKERYINTKKKGSKGCRGEGKERKKEIAKWNTSSQGSVCSPREEERAGEKEDRTNKDTHRNEQVQGVRGY